MGVRSNRSDELWPIGTYTCYSICNSPKYGLPKPDKLIGVCVCGYVDKYCCTTQRLCYETHCAVDERGEEPYNHDCQFFNKSCYVYRFVFTEK